MSAFSQSIRFKFGEVCRQLFQRPARVDAAAPAAPEIVECPPPMPSRQPQVGGVNIPLEAVLAAFPLELRSQIVPADTQNLTFTVPVGKILPELARGVVRTTFGDIRRAAPQVFAPGSENDAAQIVLPLHEILSRLDPKLLVRRSEQRKPVALPEEISSPFAGRGQGLTFGVGSFKAAPGGGEPAKEPSFARKPSLPVPPTMPFTPVAPLPFKLPEADERPLFARKPASVATSAAPSSVTPPAPPPSPKLPQSKDYFAAPPVARAMQPINSTNATPPSPDAAVLLAPLTAFAVAWPDALREEIVRLNLVDARLAMPVELIESSLKRGRVAFAWKTLRSWMRPAAPPSDATHDATELELPLSVLAPLFLARQQSMGKSQRVTVDEKIPNLFFGLPKPEPASSPKQVDTNYYTWAEATDTPRVEDGDHKRRNAPGTDFAARHVTPNEIVSRAAALEGVAGVLIALPEGLLVAGRIPPEFNGDTLAAFLPQIFAKVSQSTKELRLGELNNLNFTVGNVPWKIFRVNALFFAVFGCVGGPLPTSELARLAAELDRRR